MKKIILVALILFINKRVSAQDIRGICEKYNAFYSKVLSGNVRRSEADEQFFALFRGIFKYEATHRERVAERSIWTFPLDGYDYRAIGGNNGNGYSDKGYHFLDGNKHLAHPAHDIFINDRNQDCIDDRTGKPVNVVAALEGYVVACTNEWLPTSNLRGGKYILIFHPTSGTMTYYAHNSAVFVKPGDLVKQGQKIAEVGRTGLNAYPKRSPTHLHFSAFKIVDGILVPFNPYPQLKKAVTQ